MQAITTTGSLLAAFVATLLLAEQTTPPDKWLQQIIGEWTYESEAIVGPGQPPVKSDGAETVRALGSWVLAENSGKTPMGAGFTSILTLGYDDEKKHFVGTWICSTFNRLLLYEGSLDTTGKTLTLETEGPSFSDPGKLSKYRDIIEMKDKNTRILRSAVLADDGKWHEFQTATYRRRVP